MYSTKLDFVFAATSMAGRESFSVGDDEIDRQHESLLQRAAMVAMAIEQELDAGLQQDLLGEMIKEEALHFIAEEALMRTIGYPDVEAHVDEHERLLAETKATAKEIADGDMSCADGLHRISSVLLNHMLVWDLRYKTWVHEYRPNLRLSESRL